MDNNESLNPSVPSGPEPALSEAERVPSVFPGDKGRNWGGTRPSSGAPRGNLNAFKHGRNSRRQAQLLEALLEIPEARQALIDLGKRNRRRRKEAEEGAGVLMTAFLEKVAAIVLQSALSQGGGSEGEGATGEGSGVREINHGQNNQDFLDFLNLATAQIRTLLEKQPRIRSTSTKKLPPT